MSSVPLKIVADGRDFVDDGRLDVVDMVDYLASLKGGSGTACPNVGEWKEALSGADMAFAITIGAQLSGSYNAACVAKDAILQERPDAHVHVIDSRTTGPAMRLVAEKLDELLGEGLPFPEVCRLIDRYRDGAHIVFSLESMHNLANNGRVHPAAAKMAGLLGIRMVGRGNEGVLEPFSKAKGERKMLRVILDEMVRRGYEGGRVRISHVLNEGLALAMAESIRGRFPHAEVKWCEARGLVSFYAERNGLLVGYEGT